MWYNVLYCKHTRTRKKYIICIHELHTYISYIQYLASLYVTLHHITYTTLRYTTSHYRQNTTDNTLQTLHYTTLRYIAIHYITLRCIAFHSLTADITLHTKDLCIYILMYLFIGILCLRVRLFLWFKSSRLGRSWTRTLLGCLWNMRNSYETCNNPMKLA